MRCCGPRRGAHIRGEDRQRDRRVDMFWQTDSWSRTPPHLPLCASSPSLCLWTRAFINNLLINGLGNTGGRQIGRGGVGGGREREGIWFLYKLYKYVHSEGMFRPTSRCGKIRPLSFISARPLGFLKQPMQRQNKNIHAGLYLFDLQKLWAHGSWTANRNTDLHANVQPPRARPEAAYGWGKSLWMDRPMEQEIKLLVAAETVEAWFTFATTLCKSSSNTIWGPINNCNATHGYMTL